MKLISSTAGAVAAVAAVLAFAAVPAQAREYGRHDNRDAQQSVNEPQDRGHGRVEREQARVQVQAGEARPATHEQRAPQEQRAAQPQRTWANGRQQQVAAAQARQEQRAAQPQRTWGDGRQQQQRTYTPQAPTQQRSQWADRAQQPDRRSQWADSPQRSQWSGSAQQTERNRTYDGRDRNTTYRNTDRNWGNDRTGNDRTYRDSHNSTRNWDRSWRNNTRYDWQHYRSSNRNVYHVGRYYAPYRNYSYRRLGVGFYMDSLFFGQNYWISDPFYYRLPEVYGPYRWVRYYDDALLVDIYSGQVVDVIYDFFW